MPGDSCVEHRETANGPVSLLPEALQKIIREVVSTKKPVIERSVTLPPRAAARPPSRERRASFIRRFTACGLSFE
jgi:hypothetical protein